MLRGKNPIHCSSDLVGSAGALDGSTMAILGINGRRSHWTPAYHFSDKQMRLLDSGALIVLLRSRCTLRATERQHLLEPENIILLWRSLPAGIATASRALRLTKDRQKSRDSGAADHEGAEA